MSEDQKQHMLKSISQKIRYDGRKNDEFRKVTIEYGASKNAEGSAKVTIGETVVLAGVKMSVDKPFGDRPDEGILMVGTELLAMSNPNFEAGPPSIKSIEIARVVDRGIREAKSIDVKKLVVKEGEKVWSVSIDVVAINDAGNLMDAAGLAAMAALKDARFPKYDGVAIDYKDLTKDKLPIVNQPIPVTVLKIGNEFIVDPISDEEEFVDARLTVATTEKGEICAMQKGGSAPLKIEEIKDMIKLAKKKSNELRKML